VWKDNKTNVQLPNVYEGIVEFEEIKNNIDSEIGIFKKTMTTIANDIYVETADETGIQRYEKILGILPSAADDLEARRRKIMAKFRDKPPINDLTIIAISETFLGVKVDIKKYDNRRYYFEILYRNNTELVDATPLEKRLREVIPANMSFKVLYAYFTWRELKQTTWGTAKEKTWEQIMLGGI
jgi:hypothetical protein